MSDWYQSQYDDYLSDEGLAERAWVGQRALSPTPYYDASALIDCICEARPFSIVRTRETLNWQSEIREAA